MLDFSEAVVKASSVYTSCFSINGKAYPSDEKKLFMFRHPRDASMKLSDVAIRELEAVEPKSLLEMKETIRAQIGACLWRRF